MVVQLLAAAFLGGTLVYLFLLKKSHTRRYVKVTGETSGSWNALDVLPWVVKWGHETSFPNLILSLRIFLTVCGSVASCERRFSKFKLIKTYLRSNVRFSRELTEALTSTPFVSLKARKIRL